MVGINWVDIILKNAKIIDKCLYLFNFINIVGLDSRRRIWGVTGTSLSLTFFINLHLWKISVKQFFIFPFMSNFIQLIISVIFRPILIEFFIDLLKKLNNSLEQGCLENLFFWVDKFVLLMWAYITFLSWMNCSIKLTLLLNSLTRIVSKNYMADEIASSRININLMSCCFNYKNLHSIVVTHWQIRSNTLIGWSHRIFPEN